MNPDRRTVARAADALVRASRQAMGLCHTKRGLRVRSPLLMCSFSSTQVFSVPVDCASFRSRRIDGRIIAKLRKNMNEK